MTKSREAWICDYVRTPFGRYGGDLSPVRTDDLGAIPLEALISRNLKLDSNRINEVFMGRFFSINSNNLAKDSPPIPPRINAKGRYFGSIKRRNSALTNTKKKGI